MNPKKKILFFSHAVTLAHMARPLKWIEGLDQSSYEVYLASHPKFRGLCPSKGVTYIDIDCIDSAEFLETVQRAAPIYDAATFERHIEDDMRLIEEFKPDLVVGDFRHSLSVSCRLKKVKYVNLTSAYWSTSTRMSYPLPEAPIVRKLGEKLARALIGVFIPFALKLNFFKMAFQLRKSFRRAGLSFSDYRQVIVDGDLALFCDTPELVPLKRQLRHERFVGPVVWSMPVPKPEWWERLDSKKPRIFVSLGSSGPVDSLPLIIRSLSKCDVEITVALSGRKVALPSFPNVHLTDFLPVEDACKGAHLVICNGGSPMCHAALTYGVPVIGIVSNNDQLLNMAHIEKRGAGRMMRFWNLTEFKVISAVRNIFETPSYKTNAVLIMREFQSINAAAQFQDVLNEMLGPNPLCQSPHRVTLSC